MRVVSKVNGDSASPTQSDAVCDEVDDTKNAGSEKDVVLTADNNVVNETPDGDGDSAATDVMPISLSLR